MMVVEHGIQTFEVVVVMLMFALVLFNIFVPTSAEPLLLLKKLFVHIYLNVS